MDTSAILKVAVATVGVTQLLKNLIGKGGKVGKVGKVVWTIITILVGVGISVMQYLCPTVVMDSAIAISGASIFYDTIYKSFEKIFKHDGTVPKHDDTVPKHDSDVIREE